MIDALKRFRGPAAWLVLTALVVQMGVGIVRAVLGAFGAGGLDELGRYGLALFGPLPAAVLVAAVVFCAVVQPRLPNVHHLTRAAFVVALIGTLVQFGFGVTGLIRTGSASRVGAVSAIIDAIGYLGFTIFPVLAVVVLWKIDSGLRRERRLALAADDDAYDDDSDDDLDDGEPTWSPDRAAGAAWGAASEAARGDRAIASGRPGERGGWNPAPADRALPLPGRGSEGDPAARVRSQDASAQHVDDHNSLDQHPSDQPSGAAHSHSPAREISDYGPTALADQYARSSGDRPVRGPGREESGSGEWHADTVEPPQGHRPPPRWTPLEPERRPENPPEAPRRSD